MRTWLIILICLVHSLSFAQVFTGRSLNDVHKNLVCEVKINKDSSIIFVYHDKFNSDYHQFVGSIRKLNDTLYKIHTTSVCQLGSFEGDFDGILTITDDHNFDSFNKVTIIYHDGFKVSYDLNKSPVIAKKSTPIKIKGQPDQYYYYRHITLDPKHFHYKNKWNKRDGMLIRKSSSGIDLDIGYISPLTGKPILFRSGDYGNEFHFGGVETDFLVTIKGKMMTTIADSLTTNYTGPYSLKEML